MGSIVLWLYSDYEGKMCMHYMIGTGKEKRGRIS